MRAVLKAQINKTDRNDARGDVWFLSHPDGAAVSVVAVKLCARAYDLLVQRESRGSAVVDRR
jgi:hypothetical protein